VLVSAASNISDTPVIAEAKPVAVAATSIQFASDAANVAEAIVDFVTVVYGKPADPLVAIIEMTL